MPCRWQAGPGREIAYWRYGCSKPPAGFIRSAVPCTPTGLDGDCYEEAKEEDENAV